MVSVRLFKRKHERSSSHFSVACQCRYRQYGNGRIQTLFRLCNERILRKE
jgi:hypothetical protein